MKSAAGPEPARTSQGVAFLRDLSNLCAREWTYKHQMTVTEEQQTEECSREQTELPSTYHQTFSIEIVTFRQNGNNCGNN